MEKCDFCRIGNDADADADYGFDWEWDAFLCWRCHMAQNLMLLMVRYSVRKVVLL